MTQQNWALDSTHSELQFKVKHLMITTVTGNIKSFDAELSSNSDDFANADISFSGNINSIDTGNNDRDNHLKSADFFDAANHTHLHFESSNIVKKSEETFQITGNLTIKGVSKEITLEAEFGGIVNDPYGNERAGFTLNGKINRQDFGLSWSAALETGGLVVSDEVKLAIDAEIVKNK